MEATYKVPVTALPNLINSITALFDATDNVEIIIRKNEPQKRIDSAELLRRSEAIRKITKKIKVPADLDLSALANEVNL